MEEIRLHRLIASLFLALSSSCAALAQAPTQFDLVCAGKDANGQADAGRFSVDVDKKAWCSREEGGACQIATLFGVDGDVVIFERSALETGSYDHWVNRKTGEYRNMSVLAVPPITNDAKGMCKEAPFTPFGVTLNDAAKAARN